MATAPFLRRVRLRNYKSIGECDVELGRFTILVGRNGSGKSNFLDALAFLADAVETSVSHAAEKRGRMRSLEPRSQRGQSAEVEIAVTFDVGDGVHAEYEIAIAEVGGNPTVRRERLRTFDEHGSGQVEFQAENGLTTNAAIGMKDVRLSPRNLGLQAFAQTPAARIVADSLRSFRIYAPRPEAMRGRSASDADNLKTDGANAASVFWRLQETSPDFAGRLVDYLSAAIDDFAEVGVRAIGTVNSEEPKEAVDEVWLRFCFDRDGRIESFANSEVSDGTLHALAVFLAAMQRRADGQPVPLVGIEEPEAGLHPGASAVLMDALREASLSSQILVTTHSPDMLDRLDLDTDTLLVVENGRDGTRIGPPGEASLSVIRDRLYTAGELLRMGQLERSSARGGPQPIPTGRD